MPGGFRISLENDERLIAKLANLTAIAQREALARTADAVEVVRSRAVEGIAKGPKTGRIYTQRVARGPNGGIFFYGSRPPHQASAPSEYPAADTGTLMGSIWADVEAGMDRALGEAGGAVLSLNALVDAEMRISGLVGADAEYAAPLEYKPTERGGRPFLRRSLAESQADIHRIFLGMRGKFT